MKALPWKAVGLLLILLALAVALYGAYRHGVTVTDLAWKAKWAEEVSAQSEAVATTATDYRTEEQRRQKAANQVANDARQNQTAALTDGSVDDASGELMRIEAGKMAASASCVPSDTGASERGKAATRAAMVLSDLLGRADARARELAKAYDQSRIAGLACNRFVEELSNTTNLARP
ncbi:DUF2514 domain-containing protein [Pseudomonas sp. NFACC10-1]|uniref:DUF2514 domain-containing protein n=1 Tax=Pseudomonas sp. NFACC10-1 TaxID=1566247 RepID=UPI000908AE57|nr:DUF2514 domain-containing protein [Pseudomonas sp. NFACC10-1]SFW65415.1 Protein of unknown function [Pseudomonas sp. NFACC10-1]